MRPETVLKLPDGEADRVLRAVREERRGFLRRDPVEKTEEYLAVIDEVEAQIDCEHDAELCFSFWAVKAQLLLARGILWRSPAALNPGVLFD